ncbi:hypothetical protein [Phyllobacterium endophyticum]|nr:hypothetical protein [Phyllobacterium endophyticum]MBB3237028.1 hypothetical protein [Phyllobacterium endophyticum]
MAAFFHRRREAAVPFGHSGALRFCVTEAAIVAMCLAALDGAA